MLLLVGADAGVNKASHCGRTAVTLAAALHGHEIVRLLRHAGTQ